MGWDEWDGWQGARYDGRCWHVTYASMTFLSEGNCG